MKFFLNPPLKAYLRELAAEFDVSTNAVRAELNNRTEHQILSVERKGRSVSYRTNAGHALFPEISSMVRKVTGIHELVRSVVDRLGDLEAAYSVGDYARGTDTGIIDVVLVGNINESQLDAFVAKSEEFSRLRGKKAFDPLVNLWQTGTHG